MVLRSFQSCQHYSGLTLDRKLRMSRRSIFSSKEYCLKARHILRKLLFLSQNKASYGFIFRNHKRVRCYRRCKNTFPISFLTFVNAVNLSILDQIVVNPKNHIFTVNERITMKKKASC